MIKPIHVIVFFTLFLGFTTMTGHPDYYYGRAPWQSVAWTCLIAAQWFLLVWIDYKVIDFSQTKYPSLDQLSRRVLFSYPIMLFSGYFIIVSFDFVGAVFIFGDHYFINIPAFIANFIGAILISIIVLPTFEMLFSKKVSQRIALENLELKRRNLQGQYDTLKGQVSPHFLFNSLNSLAGLIKKNPELATSFVDEMAYVYRYLLKSNEQNKVTLKEELKFVHAYFHLLKTRFQDGIQLETDLPENDETIFIAPLTLQILIENAAKHNVVSKKRPIVIRIMLEDDRIVVRNNIRKKANLMESTKTGLANIVSKYKLLANGDIEVLSENDCFTVKIPVLA